MMDTLALSPLLWADKGAENWFRRTATPRPSPMVFMAAPYECSFLVFEREEVAGPWLKLLTAPIEAVESKTAGLRPSDALRLEETQVSRVMDWRRDRFQEAKASVSGKLAGFREVRYGIHAGVPGFVRTGGDALAARWASGLELGRDQARAGLRALEPHLPLHEEKVLAVCFERPRSARRFRLWRDLMGNPPLAEIARRIGKGKATVCRYLAGKSEVPAEVRRKSRALLDGGARATAAKRRLVDRFLPLETSFAPSGGSSEEGAVREYLRDFADVAAMSPEVAKEVIDGTRGRWDCCSRVRDMMHEAIPCIDAVPYPPGHDED